MNPTYSIANWDELFENAQSRKTENCRFVLVPNKHDGLGYRTIMAMDDGPAIYGAWVLIVQVASKCPTRGVLHDGRRPLGAKELAIKTGAPASLFELALQVASSEEVAWLLVDGSQSAPSPLPVDSQSAPSPVGLNGKERKGIEGKGKEKKEAPAAADSGEPSVDSIPVPGGKKPSAVTVDALDFPPNLDTDPCRNAMADWIDHRRITRKPFRDAKSAQYALNQWARAGPAEFVAAVEHSIASGYQGIFPPKGNQRGQQQAPGPGQVYSANSRLGPV